MVKIVKIAKMVWLVDFEITNLTVCRKSVWNSAIFDNLSVVNSCQAVIKKFYSGNGLRESKSNCTLNIILIGWVWNFTLFCQLISCYELSSCHKSLNPEIDGGDSKSNCMPKIGLISWVWNSALFWQLICCQELSSCHKKIFTSQIDWGIANLTVCQNTVWLVDF